MAAKEVSLKLLVDKRTNQVVFAESDKDFVDIILIFLTMPIGTLLRLLGKQTTSGSMSRLYESVEDLDVQFLQTKACKNMLLHPQNAYEEKLQELLVTVEDTEIYYYLCPGENHGFSTVRNTLCCECGREMNQKITKRKKNVARDVGDGVFVQGLLSYLITDDLLVLPASAMASLDLLKRHGISDKTSLEERNVKVGRKEVLRLFKRLLQSKTLLTDAFLRKDDTFNCLDLIPTEVLRFFMLGLGIRSKTPLTDDFLRKDNTVNVLDLNPRDLSHSKSQIYTCKDPKKIRIKLLLNKSTGKVSFAEVGEGFIDFLFSFLTLPLGLICKFLGGCTNVASLDNLYQSVQDNNICTKEKSELLSPKLPLHFGSANQLLPVQEKNLSISLTKCWSCERSNCFLGFDNCLHNETPDRGAHLKNPCNPKHFKLKDNLVHRATKNNGRSFMKGPVAFIVTDNLVVQELSPLKIISHFDCNNLEEQIVGVGIEEALSLLKASLTSETVLSDVFYPKKPKQGTVERVVTGRKGGNREKGGAELVCPICLSNPKDMAFGCGHQTCCECGSSLTSCPICRRHINTRIKLFSV